MGWTAYYECSTCTSPTAYIRAVIGISNTSGPSVDISTIKARYYYLGQGYGAPSFSENWGHVSSSGAQTQISVTGTSNPLSPSTTTADTYEEFSFSGATLDTGQTLVFAFELISPNQSADQWTQTGAWSFNASDNGTAIPPTTAWDHIVVLVSGNIAYGDLPM